MSAVIPKVWMCIVVMAVIVWIGAFIVLTMPRIFVPLVVIISTVIFLAGMWHVVPLIDDVNHSKRHLSWIQWHEAVLICLPQ